MRPYPIGIPQKREGKNNIDVYNWTTDFIFGDDLELEMRCVCVSRFRAARENIKIFRRGGGFSCLAWIGCASSRFLCGLLCSPRRGTPLGIFFDDD